MTRTHLGLLFVLLAAAAPSAARAQSLTAPRAPSTYEAVSLSPVAAERAAATTRTRWEVVLPGLVSFVGAWVGWVGTTIGWNLANTECGSGYFFPSCSFNGVGASGSDILRSLVPLVGPWWSVMQSESLRGWDLALPIFSGIAQAAGLIQMIVGLATPAERALDEGPELDIGPGSVSLRVPFD